MDSLHGLPPLKRLRFLQEQQQLNPQNEDQSLRSCSLPAKKRKESRDSSLFFLPDATLPHPAPISASYCLPTKKRVWALHPDFPPESLDLNVEYKPPSEEEESVPKTESVREKNEEDDENKISDVEDEDDGILCAICQSTDGDPSDPIVFCDGCDLMVHSSCYGNPLAKSVPEGDWFCIQCLASSSSNTEKKVSETPFSCCLCPLKGGAMKPTNDGRWAHIVCGLFVPEVFFEDPDGREGIDCSLILKRRWESKCYICKTSRGCAIDCSEPKCNLAFHVTCGLKEDLCIEYREERRSGAIVAGFCRNHTDLWKKQQLTGKFKIVARDEETRKSKSKSIGQSKVMAEKNNTSRFGGSILVPSVQELAKQPIIEIPSRYIRPDLHSFPIVAAASEIPVIDMSNFHSDASMHSELTRLHSASKNWGFFQLVNHGVSDSLIEKMKVETQNLFNLSIEEKKKKLWQSEEDAEGFGQAFVVSEEQKLDWCDLFFIATAPPHLRKPRLFQNLPPAFRNTMEEYSAEVKSLAMAIFEQFEKALGIKDGELTEIFKDGSQSMRMNYYPPCPKPEKVIGITLHSDAVGLTILLQINEMEGLKIKKDGNWVAVTPLPNAFIVNIGDIMEFRA